MQSFLFIHVAKDKMKAPGDKMTGQKERDAGIMEGLNRDDSEG
jgi:hypothetical protein